MLSLYLAAIENHDNDDKFIKLYKIYEKKVFSIAFGFTNNQYDAEDASQAAFFALARNIEKLDLENEKETKIYKIVYFLQILANHANGQKCT